MHCMAYGYKKNLKDTNKLTQSKKKRVNEIKSLDQSIMFRYLKKLRKHFYKHHVH